jgi:hypothetical protein
MGPLGSNEKMKRAKKTEPNKTPPERTRTSRRILDLSKNLQETKTTDMLAVTLAANVADSADDYPNGGESIRFSLQPTGGREPVWFMHLLSLFNCDSIPKSLFSRASKPSTEWNSDGELIHFDLDCLTSIRPDFSDIVRDDPVQWQQRYTSNLNRKQDLADHIDSEDLEVEGLEIFSKETQLSILAIIVSAWPEPWCEIVWEAVEEELWEVVESTCLPLLGVVSMDEIEEFLSRSTLPRMSDAFFESIQQDSEQQEKTIRNTDRSRAQLENNQAIRLPEGSEVIMEDFYTK